MWELIKTTLSGKRNILIIMTLISISMLLMYIALTPSMAGQMKEYDKLLATFPKEFLAAFNVDTASMASLEGILSTEQFSFLWPIMLLILICSLAGSAIAGEVETGTIELTMSQPITRTKYYLVKYFSGLIILIVFTALSILPAIPLAGLFNVTPLSSHFFTLTLIASLFGWSFYSFSFMVSALSSDRGKVNMLTIAIFLLMYVLKIVSALKSELKDLEKFSLFYYYNNADILLHNNILDYTYPIFIVCIIVFFIIGLIAYNKRDIAV